VQLAECANDAQTDAHMIVVALGVALGAEGRRRASTDGRGACASAAIAVGVVASVVGAALWTFAEKLSI
jgi:hypothetical protein